MADTLRAGIVGTGGLGTGLGRQFARVDDAEVVAIADISPENRASAGEALGVPVDERYGDYEAMLDGAALDAVVVATPHTLHYEQVVAAMDRGLHVLCEKPLTTDLDHARDLVARAEESEETLMVGYQRHLSETFVDARERIAEGDIEPKVLSAEIVQDWISNFEDAWRTDPDLSGGGQLYDTGSHLVDAVLWTTDLTPTAVSAEMVFHDDERRVDKQAVLNVEFEGGAVGSITVSGDSPRVREHIHVWGDEGGVYVDGREWQGRDLSSIDPEGTVHDPLLTGRDMPSKVQAFVDSVREGTEPPATARDAFYVTAVTEAAYESARTGERVPVSLEE